MLSLLIIGCLILLPFTLILNWPMVLIPFSNFTYFLHLLCLIVLMMKGSQGPNLFEGYMIWYSYTWKGKEKSIQRMPIRGERKSSLRRETCWFPDLRKSKLLPRRDGPFKIIKDIHDNAYKVDMPQEFGGSSSFNVIDLTPFVTSARPPNFRSNSVQEGEDDAYTEGTLQEDKVEGDAPALEGCMIRGRLEKIQEQVFRKLTMLKGQEEAPSPKSLPKVTSHKGQGKGHREFNTDVKLAKREPLLLMPTNMILNASPPLVSFPTGFRALLEEFKDMFPKELPHRLPPLRGIEHHIHLTPRSTLPNKTTHGTNPKESKEIQKQVGKLMEKDINTLFHVWTIFWINCMEWLSLNKDERKGSVVNDFQQQIWFKWLLMPFGLINASSAFMRLMNHVDTILKLDRLEIRQKEELDPSHDLSVEPKLSEVRP
ncbi:hypothetical protein CR513_35721, partial [Mucuna pruriens]